jgi:NAD(P)H dehydrogenase (quinone)
MQAHIVLAHPETKSYNAHLADVARRTLEQTGWGVTVSDLYAMGFDPCERAEHYEDRQDPDRFDVQAEQRFASDRTPTASTSRPNRGSRPTAAPFPTR